jgi:hypothetical protein
MLDRIIEASYLWTVDEFIAASEVNMRRQNRPVVVWGLRFVGLVLAISGGWFLPNGKEVGLVGAMLIAVAFVLFWGTSFLTRVRPLRRAFHKAGAMAQPDQKITFVIDESRIRKLTAGAESSWVWELVPSVVESPKGYLVNHAGVGHWIPNHAFIDERDRDDFAALAARRAVKFESWIRKVAPDPFS